jgi:hypothetical protein
LGQNWEKWLKLLNNVDLSHAWSLTNIYQSIFVIGFGVTIFANIFGDILGKIC